MDPFPEKYRYIIDRLGAPVGGRAIAESEIAPWRGRVPDQYLALIANVGIWFWYNGDFQLVEPLKYDPILRMVFGDDPDFKPDLCHVIGISAFGDMLVWSEEHHVVNIDFHFNSVRALKFFKPETKSDANSSLRISLSSLQEIPYNAYDDDGKPLFKRAVKAYGPLSFGEIYALKLHPALGGPMRLENFRRASALEALAIAAQAAPFVLKDLMARPPRIVRQLG